MMNFILMPDDMFPVHILIGIKAPIIRFELASVEFLTRRCDPSSPITVTKDLRDFLSPFRHLLLQTDPIQSNNPDTN